MAQTLGEKEELDWKDLAVRNEGQSWAPHGSTTDVRGLGDALID